MMKLRLLAFAALFAGRASTREPRRRASGQAAFALNWSYMYDLANGSDKDTRVAGQVGVMAPPGVAGIRAGRCRPAAPGRPRRGPSSSS